MIKEEQLVEIGQFNATHGIRGEIAATFDEGVEPSELSCIIMDMDGIYVPFFISATRRGPRQSLLLTIDGFDSQEKAATLTNKLIYALSDEIESVEEESAEDGLYAADMVGYEVIDSEGRKLGIIDQIDDATENVLFVVKTPDGKSIMIPVADEYIAAVDAEGRRLEVNLPEGFMELWT